MRLVVIFISMISLTACNNSPGNRNGPGDLATKSSVESAEPAPLIFNQEPKVPILAAFASGRLKVTQGCIVFDTGKLRYTPIWPRGTRWTLDRAHIALPNGSRLALNEQVIIPGGHMGSRSGSDLRPSVMPAAACPNEFFGVHPN